ncbi:MAG: tetratricopeptide repeat protein [Betaproteobacteria bacterium]|nr:tetratricopeptide repeat protein [Betaproteobacteria bacterium]
MSDAADKSGEVKKAAGNPAGWKISPQLEQILYWSGAGTIFLLICAVLVLETILPFAAEQPEEVAPAVLEAEQLMQERELREARIKLDEYILENPKDARAHAARGLLRSATGLYAAALDDYDRAVRLDPENIEYRQSRADINANVGWLEKAQEDYKKILIQDPSNPQALLSRARISMQQGNAEGALADIDIAIEVDPDRAEAHMMRAQLMQSVGNLQDALESYRKIENIPGDIGTIARNNIEFIEQHLQQQR